MIKSTPLLVNSVLYFTSPKNVWAVDARSGRELWHYSYLPNTGSTIGNRGVGICGHWLYLESPDSHQASLETRTGKERWKVEIADPKLDYTSTVAPVDTTPSHQQRQPWLSEQAFAWPGLPVVAAADVAQGRSCRTWAGH